VQELKSKFRITMMLNYHNNRSDELSIKTELSIAGVTDMVTSVVEAKPEVSSFVVIIARVPHTEKERESDD
jgi:hypothetical protein